MRHHSPALAAAVPALLDAAAPDVLLVELPAEFQAWLPWLAHQGPSPGGAGGPGRRRPTAGERGPAFYPFADFSPGAGRAAVGGARTASRSSPATCRWPTERGPGRPGTAAPPGADSRPCRRHGLAAALAARLTGRADDDLWDRLVEAPAPGCTPEAVRRAALLTGWALRQDAEAAGAG